MTNATYQTKQQASRAAAAERAAGHTVKVLYHSGVYTQPGRGLVSYSFYTISKA